MVREGKRIRTEHLELRAIASPLPHPRVGFIVPKHGYGSVERNRLKRRLREAARLELLPAIPAADVVIRARREAYGASYADLRLEVGSAGGRIIRTLERGRET